MRRQLALPMPRRLHPVKAAALGRRIHPDWRAQGACLKAKDPEAWFPHPATRRDDLAEPLAACAACPVRRSCLAAALLHDETGIWAGTTRAERRPATNRLAAGAPVDLVLDELLYAARMRAKEVQPA
jgi:hypothetical protein